MRRLRQSKALISIMKMHANGFMECPITNGKSAFKSPQPQNNSLPFSSKPHRQPIKDRSESGSSSNNYSLFVNENRPCDRSRRRQDRATVLFHLIGGDRIFEKVGYKNHFFIAVIADISGINFVLTTVN